MAAALARLIQFAPPVFRLPAALAMLADGFIQVCLRLADAMLTLAVPIHRLGRRAAAQQNERAQHNRKNSVLLGHRSSGEQWRHSIPGTCVASPLYNEELSAWHHDAQLSPGKLRKSAPPPWYACAAMATWSWRLTVKSRWAKA